MCGYTEGGKASRCLPSVSDKSRSFECTIKFQGSVFSFKDYSTRYITLKLCRSRYTKSDVCCLPRCGLTHIGFRNLSLCLSLPPCTLFENHSPPSLPPSATILISEAIKLGCIPGVSYLDPPQGIDSNLLKTFSTSFPLSCIFFSFLYIFIISFIVRMCTGVQI